jgi:hypothetical protein
MTPLEFDATTATPKVRFDIENNVFLMSGCSRPEDVRDFYNPILKWLSNFAEIVDDALIERFKDEPVSFKFTFDYFNSSSAKFILDVLMLINQVHQKGLNIVIIWVYAANDEDMKEVGEELSDVVDFPFQFEEI